VGGLLFSVHGARGKAVLMEPMTHPESETSWYCLTLTPEQAEFGFVDIIRAEIEEIWISRGALEGFTVWLDETGDHVKMYFSAVAAEAAKILLYRFGAQACGMPNLESLSFLLGSVLSDDPPIA